MMKRIVATLFFLSLILGGLALIIPSFIDWSAHKGAILSQLEPYIDRKIDVGGKVSFSILPSPQIMLENVTLAGAEGAKSPYFMKLRQLEARMKLGPLLQGKFEIETINLANPELEFEVLPDGRNNWTGILKEQEGIGQRPDAVKLNNISMTGGTLHYLNDATGTEWQVDDLNLTVSADTLFGPYKAKGDMRYNNTTVGIEAGTGKYETGTPVPVNINFTPAKDMPKVLLSGVADLASGLDLQTQVTVSDGPIAALFTNDFFKSLDFLNETADASAMLNIKGSGADLTDIKAKTGKKGEFSGKISVVFAHDQKPDVTADLEGNDLKITSKAGFTEIPAGFTPHLKLKGKGISWAGAWIPGVTISADATSTEWNVKEARIDLPGKSHVKLAGTVTPKTGYAAYTMQATSDDAQKMLKGAGLSDGNILKSLGASGVLKKLDVAASVDVRSDKISFSDIDGKLNGTTKVSGVLNIVRGGKTQKFDAKLNFDRGDIGTLLSDAYSEFMGSLMKSQADLDIKAGSDIAFKGSIENGSMTIDSMSAAIAPDGNFAVNGKLAGINPLSGMDLDYTLKVPSQVDLGGFGIALPPPLPRSGPVDIRGKVTGDAGKIAFTAAGTVQGADVSLDGTETQGNQGTYTAETNVTMKNAKWSQIGLPIDNLVAGGKPFDFSAKLTGTSSNYQLDTIDAGDVKGSLTRKDGKYSGDLEAKEVDFDKWLWNDWKVSDALELRLKAKKLSWRDDNVTGAQMSLEASPNAIKVSDLHGDIWGGNITADVDSTRKAGKWVGKLKGKVLGANLQDVAELMEFKGFTVGRGDLTLDLTDDDTKPTDKDWFNGMSGTIGMHALDLTVEKFNPAAVSKLLAGLDGADADDFNVQVLDALRSGDTVYKGVDGAFTVGDSKIAIDKLKLSDDDADVDVKGSYDLGPETFKTDVSVQLRKPAGVPVFTVGRMGKMESPPSYTVGVKPLAAWMAKRDVDAIQAPPQLENPAPVVLAPEEKPLHETVITPEGAVTDPPIQVYPPVEKPVPAPDGPGSPDDGDADEAAPATPPPAVTPGDDDNGEIINTQPIDTEQLDAPPSPDNKAPTMLDNTTPPPPDNSVPPAPKNNTSASPDKNAAQHYLVPPPGAKPVPQPTDKPADKPKTDDSMKGVLDRLNDLPDAPEPPEENFGEQKPDAPVPLGPQKKDDEEILPRE